MKKVMMGILSLAAVLTGCNKDDIFLGDLGDVNGSGSTSGVDGATTHSFSEDSEDLISGTTFARTISITFSDSGSATVSGDVNGIVSVSGNQVTVKNTTSEKIKYELSGTTNNGYLKIYSSNKQALVLNGVSITNPSGAAINNQGKKRCFVVVNGQNSLADGTSYTATPSDEDEKAAFFSEGQLIFSGEGSLKITAQGKSGLISDDYIHFMASPVIEVSSSAGHAVRGKDAVIVSDGTLTAKSTAPMKKGIASDSLVVFNGGVTNVAVTGSTAYDDEDKDYKSAAGIKADQLFVMNGGVLSVTSSGVGGKGISGDGDAYFQGGTVEVTVTGGNYGSSSNNRPGGWGGNTSSSNSKGAKGIKFDGSIYISEGVISAKASNHEGIESKGKIEITGGTVYAQSKDDAINSAGMLAITGGEVCAYSTGNDGLDANGNCYIEGGVVYAIGSGSPEVAIDANTEKGYTLYVNGGTLFAIGGLENGAVLSQACYQASWTANKWYGLTVGNNAYAFLTPGSGGSGLVVSGASKPGVKLGVTVSGGVTSFNGMGVFGASISGGTDVNLSSYSGGSNGRPGQGFGGGW